MRCTRSPLSVAILCVAVVVTSSDRILAMERPFILWNKQDIAAICTKIETQAWAQAAYKRLTENPDRHERRFSNLLRYAITGDKEAGQTEKKELMRTVRSPVPRGAAQYINAVGYDLLYELLTSGERREVEKCFRTYIDNHIFRRLIFDPNIFNDSANYSRYDARKYTRSNWLPNIIWPWKVSANLMAVALGDEALIRKTWVAYGSWKWYFDEYLCDIGFYSEEFSKMGSTPGAMLLYCRGLERLGLNDLGYGYKGKGGATMRGHIESLIHLVYPRLDVGSQRPQYPMLTIGDLRQSGSSQSWNLPSPAFQHSLVMGYTADGRGGTVRWKAHGAWGGVIRSKHAQWDGYTGFTPKMQIPFWFEIGHARWPSVGFDYFLAQMRGPDEDKYYPSLYFGLDPVSPATAEAPPAPSAVWPERGLVMLRADESRQYWESAAPAVAMRLARNYAHNVLDCFALVGFYAYNRPIYLNRQVTPGYAQDWSRSIQSHCGVTVDGAEPKFTNATTVRKAFNEGAKFIAARNKDVFPGVDLTRSLVLTGEYLLDVTRLVSEHQREYSWFLHALGQTEQGQTEPWKDSQLPEGLYPLKEVHAYNAGEKAWSVKVLQTCALEEPSKAKLPRRWYDRKIGVSMNMLPGVGTTAYIAQTPLPVVAFRGEDDKRQYKEVASEVGGVTIIAVRRTSTTTFCALHEPFEGGQHRIVDFRYIGDTGQGLAVAVVGKFGSGINDRLMVRLGDNWDKPLTLADDRESFTFANWAYLRIGKDKVEVSGDLRAMKLAVEGQAKLLVDGKTRKATFVDGYLSYNGPP